VAFLEAWHQFVPEGAGFLVLVELNHRNEDIFDPAGSTLNLPRSGIVDSQGVPVAGGVERPAD